MVYFNIKTLNSVANQRLQTSFINIDVAIATFINLVKTAVLKERLNKTCREKQAKSFEPCINVYLMYLCEMTGAKQHIHKSMVYLIIQKTVKNNIKIN